MPDADFISDPNGSTRDNRASFKSDQVQVERPLTLKDVIQAYLIFLTISLVAIGFAYAMSWSGTRKWQPEDYELATAYLSSVEVVIDDGGGASTSSYVWTWRYSDDEGNSHTYKERFPNHPAFSDCDSDGESRIGQTEEIMYLKSAPEKHKRTSENTGRRFAPGLGAAPMYLIGGLFLVVAHYVLLSSIHRLRA